MKKRKPDWLSGCTVCNAGIVSRIDELIKDGNSIWQACKILEAEAWDADGVLSISANAIRLRYGQIKGGKDGQKDQSIPSLIRQIMAHLRPATTKMQILNALLEQEGVTQVDGIEGFLAKVDLARFCKEFTTLLRYFQENGIVDGEMLNHQTRGKQTPGMSPALKDASTTSSCRAGDHGEKTKIFPRNEIHPVSDALNIIEVAKSQLERINPDDPHREDAFDVVVDWINKNRMTGGVS